MRRPIVLFLLWVGAMLIVPSMAFAQTFSATPQPTISTPVVVVTVLSLLMGFITQAVQTGSFLGIAVLPQKWLPDLTLFGSFIAGMAGYLGGLANGWTLNASTVYFAAMAGLTALLAGAGPGLARHAHTVVPARIMAMKMGKLLGVLCLLFLATSQSACLSSAPIVPQTAANTSQIQSCQSIANLHNGVMLGGILKGGAATTLASVAAVDTSPQAKNDFAITAAILAGLTAIDAAVSGYTSSEFAAGQCSVVVGPLPLGEAK